MFLQARIVYISVVRYKLYKIGQKLKGPRVKITQDRDNNSLCTLNTNIVIIIFEKSFHNI